MREAAGLTQAQVEKRSGLKQPEISKLEAESSLDERQVSTVRRYLAALGDELELVSVSKYGHRIGVAPVIPAEGAERHATKPSSGVPEVDARSGEPLPPWRVARWHLLQAARLLSGTYFGERSIDANAAAFAKAADIAMQLYSSLDDRASSDARNALLAMARSVEWPTKTTKSAAERSILERLPKTTRQAKAECPATLDDDGARAHHLASWVLYVIASQRHADAGEVLRRWGTKDVPRDGESSKFEEDRQALASEIYPLLQLSDDAQIAKPLLRAAYRVLGLHRPLDAANAKRRRKANGRT
jgi:transcriptional regulator with XRE-family HTH domain